MLRKSRALAAGALAAALIGGLLLPATAAVADDGIAARDVVGLLETAPAASEPAYERARFEHWIDADGNGCNTRYEVLIRDSLTPAERVSGCKLTGGSWQSRYDGLVADDPAGIEIDHVVALAEAWRSGAWAWDDAERRAFANDLGVDYALVPSSTASNQAKADKDPSRWLPSDAQLACSYVTEWALIKYRWSLAVDEAEAAALGSALAGECGDRTVQLPAVMREAGTEQPGGSEPGEDPGGDDPGQTVITALPAGETRLAGSNRYATAISVSSRYAPGVPAVFVATGRDFPDALSASAAAAKIGAPLLLTETASLPAAVSSEISRLAPKRIYVIGGAGAVSGAVADSLTRFAPVTRISGSDRFSTGLQVVSQLFPGASFAVVATGRNFPDALAATGVAGVKGGPVILVDGGKSGVPSSTLAELRRLGVRDVMIAGGAGVVSNGIANQLANAGMTVQRLGGSDRYRTAAAINSANFSHGSTTHYFLATGQDFPDALAGAALAGRLGMPLYVTRPDCMPDAIRASVDALGTGNRAVLGGTGSVSAAAAAGGKCAVAPPKPPKPPKPGPPTVPNPVTPGAYCKKAQIGYLGYTTTGKLMRCTLLSGETTPRWRAVA